MDSIAAADLRRIADSSGDPTAKADVRTETGRFGRVTAPSVTSTEANTRGELAAADGVNATNVDADGTDDFSGVDVNDGVVLPMAVATAVGSPFVETGAVRGNERPSSTNSSESRQASRDRLT